MNRKNLLVIGYGKIGRLYADIFSNGFNVKVSSTRNIDNELIGKKYTVSKNFTEDITSADFIFIAVPIRALDPVIERINKHVKADCWAFDMCSARIAAKEKMSKLKCNWFGIHTGGIFQKGNQEIIKYLKEQGIDFKPMDENEHDLQNSKVGLIQFIGLSLIKYLSDDDINVLNETSNMSKHVLDLMEHIKNNSKDTYFETQVLNNFTKNERKKFIECLDAYNEELGDEIFLFD